MADQKNQNQSNQPAQQADANTAALETQLKAVEEKNAQLVESLKSQADANTALTLRLESLEKSVAEQNAAMAQLALQAKQRGQQPDKKFVDPILVDRSKLTAEQQKLITAYDIHWLGPKADDYVQPVRVETLGTANKAITHWRNAMNFSPEGLQGVRAVLVIDDPKAPDAQPATPGAGE